MSKVKDFLLMCSGADKAILEECPTDVNKYVGIGGTVLFTGVLAFFSSAYAIYTVFDNYLLAFVFGLVWGLMIFNLDRYIVSSMKSRGSKWNDWVIALPRLALAVLLAIVISKPLELKIFEKEINAELITMEQEVFTEQETEVKERYESRIKNYEDQVTEMQNEIAEKTALRDRLAMMALQEADGTGGSGKRNVGPIYWAKKREADNADQELESALLLYQPIIQEKQGEINQLQAEMQSEMAALDRKAYGGMAARMEALDRLGQESNAIWLANIFIMLLFIAIETAPIFVKLISRRSPYDYVLHEREYVYQMANAKNISNMSTTTNNAIQFQTEVEQYRLASEIQLEKERIDHYIEQSRAELWSLPQQQTQTSSHSQSQSQTLDEQHPFLLMEPEPIPLLPERMPSE